MCDSFYIFAVILISVSQFTESQHHGHKPTWNYRQNFPNHFMNQGFNPQMFAHNNFGQHGYPHQAQFPAHGHFQSPGSFPHFGFGPGFGPGFPTMQMPSSTVPSVVPSKTSTVSAPSTSNADEESKLIDEIFSQQSASTDAIPAAKIDDTTFPEDCEACYDIDVRVENEKKMKPKV